MSRPGARRRPFRRAYPSVAASAFLLFWSVEFRSLSAAAPVLDHIYPAGAQLGTTNLVSLSGKFDPWPVEFWSDPPGLQISTQTNKGKIDVVIQPDAAAGPRLIRAFNEEGAGEPRIFVVGESPELSDTEPNDRFDRAQRIESLPAVLNGRLDRNGDVDSFAVTLAGGQWFDARIEAYVLFSKMDGLLRLVSADGIQLAWNHDFRTLDPRLIWRAPSNGTYVLQVMAFPFPATAEVRLAGGEGFVYRLHLGSSPEAVCLTRGPIKEPPGDTSFEIPFIHATRYSQPGEIHRFRFKAAKGETIEVQGTANAVGSPVDLWLAVEDASGKELTRSDDAPNTTDPRLEWTAPADGDYRIVAGNLLAGAGLHHTYEISARQLTPDFKANFKTSSVAAVPGQTNTVILITDRMRGHTNQLTLEFAGLPEGVTVSPLEVPAKGGELTLNFVTGTEVAPTNTLLRVTVKDLESGTTRPIGAELTSSTVDNGVPGGFTELLRPVADGLWLTVRPKPPEKPPAQTP